MKILCLPNRYEASVLFVLILTSLDCVAPVAEVGDEVLELHVAAAAGAAAAAAAASRRCRVNLNLVAVEIHLCGFETHFWIEPLYLAKVTCVSPEEENTSNRSSTCVRSALSCVAD